MGKHGHGDGTWDAVVVKVDPDGSEQTVYYVPTPMFRLDDAALDAATGKFYFVGGAKRTGFPDSDFAVTCVDISVGSGDTCAGFGGSGTAYVHFDLGGNQDDVARRVVVRPNIGLLLGGWARSGTNSCVFAAVSLYRATGALCTGFGSSGRFHSDLGSHFDNLDVNVFDMALSNDPDSEARLYIAGNYSRDTARRDYDGVVLALNAMTGQFDTGFNGGGFRSVYLDLGNVAVNRSDAVTAMTVQANGKLALAGYSINTRAETMMMIARLKIDGSLDSGLCGGSGKCAPFDGQPSGLPRYFWPSAIAERPNTRDWVIASEYKLGGNGGTADRMLQYFFQFSRSGNANGSAVTTFGASGVDTPWNTPAGMLMTSDAVMAAGTRLYSAADSDYDATLVRLLASDTIYADSFGGSHSD